MDDPILTVSVIIPTYNRPKQLRRCLEGLAAQNCPREAFEVIVVDDGGTESLTEINEVFRSRLQLVFLRQQNSGPASARNTGVRHAKGRYIALTDDDCVPASDWLRHLGASLNEGPDQLCGGQVLNGLPDNVYSTASQAILEVVYKWQWKSKGPRFFTTNNLAFSAEKFSECGKFDPLFRVSEDREFCDRWSLFGGKLMYARQAIVYHKHDLNFRDFVRQHFQYGRGAFRFYRVRSTRSGAGLRVDIYFYLHLLSHSIKRPVRQGILVLGAVFVSQLANVAGYLWERIISNSGR